MAQYSIAQATVTIPGSFSRLKKQGYAATINMAEIWQLVVPQDQAKTDAASSEDEPLPVLYVSRIKDEIEGTVE